MTKFLEPLGVSIVLFVAVAAAPASFAQDKIDSSLEIKNFIGSIDWSNGPLSVEIEKNPGETKIAGRNSLVVDGGQNDIDGSDCKSTYGRFDFDWFGKKKDGHFGGYKGMEDLPVLSITMPENTNLILRDSVVFTAGSPDVGTADIALLYCGEVTLGDVEETLALDSRGSADVTVGDTGQIVANLKGSGDLTGGRSADVLIESRGSADVKLENLTSLDMSIHGSGDVFIENIDGDVEINSHGSGDIQLSEVKGSLSYTGHGSGDLEIDSVKGEYIELSSNGSGDIDIDGGQVSRLGAIARGSSDIEYEGGAQIANLKTSGSGDIYVYRVTGAAETKSSGSGDIEIDERN